MKNPVTTISGIVLLLISALTLFGVITQEQAGSIEQYAGMIVEAVIGLIAVFKAGDKGGV